MQLMDIEKQHAEYAEEYEKAVINVLRSGRYIGGPEVENFEQEFSDYCGAKYGISCASGTDALVIALRSLNIGLGDEIITSTWTFFATAESIAAVGATPVFVDVYEDTYCINCEQVEEKITPNTRAIVAVNFYGNSCDMTKLRNICKMHNIKLVMDCAQSAGTEYQGKKSGALGDISCFSFFPTKNLGCAGDGGMIITDDEELANTCKAYRVHGAGLNGLATFKSLLTKEGKELPSDLPIGETKYYNYLIGYNSRLDAIQAALLRVKLLHLEEFIEKRRRNAKEYITALCNTDYGTPIETEGARHSFYIFALQHKDAERITSELKKRDISTGVYYPIPMHLQGAFANLGYKKGDFPVAERLCKTTFAIPIFPELSDKERSAVIAALIELG